MEAASAGSLGPIGRFRFWKSNYNTGFSFKRVIFARPNEADFEAVGWDWGAWAWRVGWCGAVLGVWARLADFDLGVKLTLGFHLNGRGGDVPLETTLLFFFPGSRPGRGGRIPRAVSIAEAGLLVGYGRCGCPGAGVGCAGTVSGVPGVTEYSR